MTFEIKSKCDIGNLAKLHSGHTVAILDVKLLLFDNYYRINYLVEYKNRERKWVEESSLEKVESDGTL